MPQKQRKSRKKQPVKTARTAKKAAWGGRRPGAGRPAANPEGQTEFIGATIPATLVAELDALAAEREWNRSQAVTEAVRRLIKAWRRSR